MRNRSEPTMPFAIATTPSPFFSIVLPTFNRRRLVARAIESVLAQSFQDFELLIIDDGSRDNTHEVVLPFVHSDPRVRYHYGQNRGLALARNLGLQISTGRYITFLDSDDEYLSSHLRIRAAHLAQHSEIQLLHGGVEIVGDAFVADKFHPELKIHLSECVIGGTFVVRRDLAEQLEGYHNIAYGDDNDFFERAMLSGAIIEKLSDPTYRYYRDEADSLCAIVEREGIAGIEKFRKL